jgi:hypothetical protein
LGAENVSFVADVTFFQASSTASFVYAFEGLDVTGSRRRNADWSSYNSYYEADEVLANVSDSAGEAEPFDVTCIVEKHAELFQMNWGGMQVYSVPSSPRILDNSVRVMCSGDKWVLLGFDGFTTPPPIDIPLEAVLDRHNLLLEQSFVTPLKDAERREYELLSRRIDAELKGVIEAAFTPTRG